MAIFDKNQKSLLIVNVLRIILELFTSTFLTSHILSITPDDLLGSGLLNIGLFYLTQYIVFYAVYFALSFFVDKSNRVSLLRIGVIINGILLVLLAFFGEQIASWIIAAGVICGVSTAFYFASYNVMKNELNGRKSIKDYNLWSTLLNNIAKMVVPTILGYLIDATTYSYVAIYVIIIATAQLIATFFIKSIKPKNSDFDPIEFVKFLKSDKDSWDKLKPTYFNSLLAGIKTTFNVIVIILTIYTFKTDLSLGIFTSIFSLVTMLLLMLYKKSDNNPKVSKKAIYTILGLLPLVACIVMVIWLNQITLVIFNFTLTLVVFFTDYIGGSERDTVIKNINKYEYIAEHQSMVELCLTIGRIFAFGIFILFGLFASLTAFKILLVLMVLSNPFKFIFMYQQRKVRKEFEIKNQQLVLEGKCVSTNPNAIMAEELDTYYEVKKEEPDTDTQN